MNPWGYSWFNKYQSFYLKALNHPLTKDWMRYAMRIDHCVDPKLPIVSIQPNHYVILLDINKNNQPIFQADFRTRNRFSIRTFYSGRSIWKLFHKWDEFVNSKWMRLPQLDLGFDSGTFYPDPDPESNSCDGYTQRGLALGAGGTWESIRDGVGTGSNDSSTGTNVTLIASDTDSPKWRYLRRGHFYFYTVSLGSCDISAADIYLCGNSKDDPLGIEPSWAPYGTSSTGTTSLSYLDFASKLTTELSNSIITWSGFSNSNYNQLSLNTSGIANIAKQGLSRFMVGDARYDTGALQFTPVWASPASSYLGVVTSEDTSGTKDPKLIVAYSYPIGPMRKRLGGIPHNAFRSKGVW